MTRATLNLALMSPSRRAGVINRSTKLTLEADLLLPVIASECGHENVSDFMREAVQFYASAKKAAHAAALKSAMHVGRTLAYIVAMTIPALSLQGVDMRRAPNIAGARAQAFARRES